MIFRASPAIRPVSAGPGLPRCWTNARNALPAGGQIDGSDDRSRRGGGFMELNSFRKQFADVEDACALAQAIVDTVREPVLVLDKALRVIAASRSFYSLFQV